MLDVKIRVTWAALPGNAISSSTWRNWPACTIDEPLLGTDSKEMHLRSWSSTASAANFHARERDWHSPPTLVRDALGFSDARLAGSTWSEVDDATVSAVATHFKAERCRSDGSGVDELWRITLRSS